MRLVQYLEHDKTRRVGYVADDASSIIPFKSYSTTYDLAVAAISKAMSLNRFSAGLDEDSPVNYNRLISSGRVLVPVDHPEPARFWITGTGLTHIGSADARDKMHLLEHGEDVAMTDSMKIFKMGIEGGKPAEGEIGVQPEWFFKGLGTSVVPPEADIALPDFALSGGEEAEIVGLYIIGSNGDPWRLGFAIGNEFSDQITEAQNYLYLAHSKLRQCSIGPELLLGELPDNVTGAVRVFRGEKKLWEGEFLSGESNMSHSISNLEHYHFRYDIFRRPGDLHAYFFGASLLSCANGISTANGDCFEIDVPVFGKPLRNKMVAAKTPRFQVHSL